MTQLYTLGRILKDSTSCQILAHLCSLIECPAFKIPWKCLFVGFVKREKVRNWVGMEVRVWEELGEGKHDRNAMCSLKKVFSI